jgi:flagellar M-ring protein FliF
MPAQVTAVWGRFAATLKKFTIAQRTLAVIGLAVLLLGGLALSSWMTKPTMSPLFTSLSAADASSVVDQLNTDGVAYQLTDGGSTVMVPANKLYDERLKLAAAGLPANSDGTGYGLLDTMSSTASDFQQQITYQRALEGELAKTVGAMQGVQTATVKLAIPQDTVFVATKADPTASVFVRTKAGVTLTADQVQAIVHLVSAGIENMKPTDVAVIDSTGKVLSTVGGSPAAGTSGQQTGDYEARVQAAVQALLDQVVGAGKSAVTLNAVLNYDNTQRTTENFSAAPSTPPLASSTKSEQYSGTGSAATGVLGPDNIAVPSGNATNGTYASASSDLTNAVDKVTEVTTAAPGSVQRQSLAVAIDAKAAAGVDMTQLSAMLSAAAGIDPARGDTIAVQALAFDTSTAKAAQDALAAADAQAAKDSSAALIRQGVIGGVVLLIVLALIIAVARRSRRSRRESLDLGELSRLDRESDPLGILGGPDGVPALPAGMSPVPTDSDTVIAGKRAEISALADAQPTEVADLLRGWLAAPSGRR